MKWAKKLITGAAILSTLLLGKPAEASSLETLIGNQGIALDVKLDTELAPRLWVLNRNQISLDYEGNMYYFGLTDVNVNLVEGLDLVLEPQYMTDFGFVPRAGFQYFHQLGNLSLYALATVKTGSEPDGEVIVDVTYTHPLGLNGGFVAGVEHFTNFAEEHNLSTQKLRFGFYSGKDQKYVVGVGANLNETEEAITYNIGLFLKTNL